MRKAIGRGTSTAAVRCAALSARMDGHLRTIWTLLVRRYPLLGGILLLLVAWLVWGWLNDYVEPATPSERTDLMGTVAQIIGGAVLLYGAFWTARNVQINREGQITERFTRAIDQLGAIGENGEPRLEIRLGGIYALERIARDSPADHPTVMEVLTAYVRDNARVSRERQEEWRSLGGTAWPERSAKREEWRAPGDVQAALSVVARRHLSTDRGEPLRLDLSQSDLRHAVLSGAHFRHVNLIGADLESAVLDRADLRDALLGGANLRDAILTGADLRGAWLIDAILVRAGLSHAQLNDANLYGVHLEWAQLWETHFEGQRLSKVHLDGASLAGAHLERTQYHEVSFYNASLGEAHLNQANLRDVDLRTVHDLTPEQVAAANIDKSTLLPDYLDASFPSPDRR